MEQVIRDRISIFQRKRVPDGYKKLYNGILPKDWHVKKICDIKDPNDKYSLTGGPFGSDLKSEHYTDDGIRIIQLQNIGDGRFIDDYKIYTSHKKADELINCNIYPGEIIISKMAEPLARACIIPSIYNRYLMASDGIRLNVDNSKYNSKFVLECINSSYFRAEAIKRGTGTTRLRIGLNVLGNLKIPVPSLTEQKKIADIFSTWDKAIELKEKLIEEKKKQKTGLIQKLYTGKIRIPGFSGKVQFEKLNKYIKESKKRNRNNEEERVLSVSNKLGFVLQEDQFDRIVASKDLSNYKVIRKGQFAYNPSRVNVGSIDLLTTYESGLLSPMYVVFQCKQGLVTEYLYHFIKSDTFLKIIPNLLQGSVRDTLSFDSLGLVKIFLPSIEEQNAIAQRLNLADKEISLLEKELEGLKQQKKGLMQLLLTGIIRVNTQENEKR